MAPSATQQVLLSPAELSYLHTSLALTPPIRPDARTSTQFRPLIAETNILPGTNGSARICFADGTEAIVGVKAEVEKSHPGYHVSGDEGDDEEEETRGEADDKRGLGEWVELTVEIPGFRDDDSMPVFLAAMLSEALLADAEFTSRLWINRRFHWKLYLDVNPPIRLWLRGNNVLTLGGDFTALAATVVSVAAALAHFTSCAALNKAAEVKVGAR
jgi:exosome complex component RRP42